MSYTIVLRAALAIAFVASFRIAPLWICLAFWYGLVVAFGTQAFLRRLRENEVPWDASEFEAAELGIRPETQIPVRRNPTAD